ncbi:hypothetical protein Pcaca04_25260 [Pectobacterium carotovorum subsp. carotovorum]|nr:hypothetical protein Pcaca04_25260 [Pectobacterium carotovorum subsp. carotovorum]
MKNKSKNYIPIVSDGAIASPVVGDGRLIPVLLLDCTNHPEFINLIQIHQSTPPGDVKCRWGYNPFNRRFVELELNFLRPVELEIKILFDLRTQPAIADSIVQAKSVYLQESDSNGRLASSMDKPKIIIEVPPKTKLPKWDSMLLTQIEKKMKQDGVGKKSLKNAAEQHLAIIREFSKKRIS